MQRLQRLPARDAVQGPPKPFCKPTRKRNQRGLCPHRGIGTVRIVHRPNRGEYGIVFEQIWKFIFIIGVPGPLLLIWVRNDAKVAFWIFIRRVMLQKTTLEHFWKNGSRNGHSFRAIHGSNPKNQKIQKKCQKRPQVILVPTESYEFSYDFQCVSMYFGGPGGKLII